MTNPPDMALTENSIQYTLYVRAQNRLKHYPVVPNVYLFREESDLISVTPAGYIHEYEIKLSRADFTADFRNKRRHKFYVDPEKQEKTRAFNRGIRIWKRPNYFWFAVPENLVSESEVPDYAGLIYIRQSQWNDYGSCRVVKKPVKISKEKITANQTNTLVRSLTYRFWSLQEQVLYLVRSKKSLD